MKWFLQRLPLLLLSAAGLAVAVYALWPQPVPVDLAEASEGPLSVTIEEDGKTRVRERYLVSAPVEGQMARIELEPGDAVEAGQTLLAQIRPADPALLDERSRLEAEARVRAASAAAQQAESRIAEARETHGAAQHEYERLLALRRANAVSAAEFDAAEHEAQRTAQAVRSAEFALQVARFEQEQAEAVLLLSRPAGSSPGQRPREDFEIHAPITGRVLRKLEESARVVTPGLPLLEVGDLNEMEVEIDILSADAAAIEEGASVWLNRWGGEKPLEARVRMIEPAGFTKISALGVEEQRVNVIADFVDPPSARPGLGDAYRVEAEIVVWNSPRVLKVPIGCLFRHQGQWAVYVADGGRARRQVVEIGHQSHDEAEILRGLSAGQQVILHPSDKLADGTRIVARTDP